MDFFLLHLIYALFTDLKVAFDKGDKRYTMRVIKEMESRRSFDKEIKICIYIYIYIHILISLSKLLLDSISLITLIVYLLSPLSKATFRSVKRAYIRCSKKKSIIFA